MAATLKPGDPLIIREWRRGPGHYKGGVTGYTPGEMRLHKYNAAVSRVGRQWLYYKREGWTNEDRTSLYQLGAVDRSREGPRVLTPEQDARFEEAQVAQDRIAKTSFWRLNVEQTLALDAFLAEMFGKRYG